MRSMVERAERPSTSESFYRGARTNPLARRARTCKSPTGPAGRAPLCPQSFFMPSMAINYIIAVEGIYPTRN